MGKFDAFFKGGGGHTILTTKSYRWTDEFATQDGPKPWKATKFKNSEGKMQDSAHRLFFELTYRVDGADVDSVKSIAAGNNFEAFEVSEDGLTLSPAVDGARISSGTAFAKLLGSLVNPDNGGPGLAEEQVLDDDTLTTGDFGHLMGLRLDTYNRTDEQRTKQFGQREVKKGKYAGRKFDRQDWVVYAYLGQAEAVPATKSNGAVKGAVARPAAPTATKSAGKAQKVANNDFDVVTAGNEVLKTILRKAKGPISKDRLSTAILNNTLTEELRENRDQIRTYLYEPDNLEQIEGVKFNRTTGQLSLTE